MLIPGGFLDARGWATGSGARASFTGASGPSTSGVAAIQSGADGTDQIFVATSDDGVQATADAAVIRTVVGLLRTRGRRSGELSWGQRRHLCAGDPGAA